MSHVCVGVYLSIFHAEDACSEVPLFQAPDATPVEGNAANQGSQLHI